MSLAYFDLLRVVEERYGMANIRFNSQCARTNEALFIVLALPGDEVSEC
jgi:hypothetical protein